MRFFRYLRKHGGPIHICASQSVMQGRATAAPTTPSAPSAPPSAVDTVAVRVLDCIVAARWFTVVARCAGVSRLWRGTVVSVIPPDSTLHTLYDWHATVFVTALPGIMTSTYGQSFADLTIMGAEVEPLFFTTEHVGHDSPADFDEMLRAAVRHVVRGLKAHLHCESAVLACLREAYTILDTLQQLRSHPSILAGPIMWTLMRVLCAHPGNARLDLTTMQLISAFLTTMSEGDDMVVLSAAKRARTIAVMNAFVDNFDTSQRHMELRATCPYSLELRDEADDAREWIEAGALLSIEGDA